MKADKSLNKEFEQILRPFVERIKERDGVEGIVVLGGLGKRNHVDGGSDIDAAIFFTAESKAPEWLPNFEFSVRPEGSFGKKLVRLGFNVHQQELLQQKTEAWNQVKKDAYSKGIIAYDRSGKVAKLIKQKTIYNKKFETEILLKAVSKLPPYIKINPKKQAKRGLYLIAHQLLNEGVDIIAESLFALNQKFLPHDKWKLEETLSLSWLPANFERDLSEGLLTKSFTLKDVERRQEALGRIADQILRKTEEKLGDIEPKLYERACKTILQRQYLKETFADKVLKKLKDSRKCSFTELEREKVFGFINYHLIKGMDEFELRVNSLSASKIEGLLECKKALQLLKK